MSSRPQLALPAHKPQQRRSPGAAGDLHVPGDASTTDVAEFMRKSKMEIEGLKKEWRIHSDAYAHSRARMHASYVEYMSARSECHRAHTRLQELADTIKTQAPNPIWAGVHGDPQYELPEWDDPAAGSKRGASSDDGRGRKRRRMASATLSTFDGPVPPRTKGKCTWFNQRKLVYCTREVKEGLQVCTRHKNNVVFPRRVFKTGDFSGIPSTIREKRQQALAKGENPADMQIGPDGEDDDDEEEEDRLPQGVVHAQPLPVGSVGGY